MPVPIYTQTIIAFLWDFDKTLIPGYQQDPLFEHYDVPGSRFWDEVNLLPACYQKRKIRVDKATAYLGHILTYVRLGIFEGLTNDLLRELGSQLEMCPGMPEFLKETKDLVQNEPRYASHGIAVEHYVISSGLRMMIEGSPVGSLVDDVWANDFIDEPPLEALYLPEGWSKENGCPPDAALGGGELRQNGYAIDDTTKTRAVFEINKGINKLERLTADVNQLVPEEERRVPIKNMIYIADGPSDVPVFSIVNKYGGKTLGVYSADHRNFEDVKSLEDQGRINSMAEANYETGSQAHLWLTTSLVQIAEEIVKTREDYIRRRPGAPGHTI